MAASPAALVASVLIAVAGVGPVQRPETGTVHGTVRSEASGEPLSGAVVEIVGPDRVHTALADSAGEYRLEGVPAGRRMLRARYVGYAPLQVEVRVPASGTLTLELSLRLAPVSLRPLEVTARPGAPAADTAAAPVGALAAAAARSLESGPGVAELGVGEAGAGAPGHDPVDPADVFYVRGSAANLKSVLLDGAPVYAPFHLSGLIRPFEPSVLRQASLYLGGAPAAYDGGLSYIMDLGSRAGRRDGRRTTGAVDLISARAMLEGPLGGRAGVLAAGRAVHPFGVALLWSTPFPYAYADGLVRTDVELGEEATLRATGFWNREAIRLDHPERTDLEAVWGNTAGSVRYEGPIAGVDASLVAAFGRFDTRLPLAGPGVVLTDGRSDRTRLAAGLAGDAGPVRIHYGATYDHIRVGHRVPDTPLPLRREGSVAGAYLDARWQPHPRLRLRSGLRLDVFSLDPAPRLAPRISATWLVSDDAALTLAAGRYHQYARPPDSTLAAAAAAKALLPRPDLSVAGATHVVLRMDQDLGGAYRLGLEGYFKQFRDVPGIGEAAARASGVDLWLQSSGAPVRGWLGYSLEWVWTVAGDGEVVGRFAGRHLLSAGASGALGDHGNFGVRLVYGAGLPYTALRQPVYGAQLKPQSGPVSGTSGAEVMAITDGAGAPLAGPPEEPYLRIDAEVSRRWTVEWRGTALRLTPYLKILNALGRRDALFFRADPSGTVEPVASLPLVPVAGVRWVF